MESNPHIVLALGDAISLLKELSGTTGDIAAAIGEMRSELKDWKSNCARCDDSRNSKTDGFEASRRSSVQRRHSSVSGMEEDAFVASTLPLAWPSSLQIRSFGLKTCSSGITSRVLSSKFKNALKRFNDGSYERQLSIETSNGLGSESSTLVEQKSLTCSHLQNVALLPSSIHYQMFEMLGLGILFVDLLVTPYVVAFEIEVTSFTFYFGLVSAVYWSCHFLTSFFTGYYSELGELVVRKRLVFCNFLKTWFLLDSVVLACSWLSISFCLTSSVVSSVSLANLLRCLRLPKLLRITDRFISESHMFHRCEGFIRFHVSAGLLLLFKTVWVFLGFMWVSHLMSCAWYGIGTFAPSDTGASWMHALAIPTQENADGSLMHFLQFDLEYKYSTCFLWAVSQVTLSGNTIAPTTSFENAFCVFCNLIGFIFGSMLVSLLSAGMVEYQILQNDNNKKLRMLRQYLDENGVCKNTAMKITAQAIQRLVNPDSVAEEDVSVLTRLSTQSLRELRYVIRRQHLQRHALFRLWDSLDDMVVQQMCSSAVDMITLREKDDLFIAGHDAMSMYYLITGNVLYTQEGKTSAVLDEVSIAVPVGHWFSEAALWSYWIHVGTAESVEGSCFLKVMPTELFEILRRNLVIYDLSKEYSQQFHKRLVSAKPPEVTWPTDISVPLAEYWDLVFSMPKHMQVVIGFDALSHMSKTNSLPSLAKLREEVDSAKSLLVVDGDGTIFRVVNRVAVDLKREDDESFMQIGKREGQCLMSSCQLPEGELERDELCIDAMNRFVKTTLPLFQNKFEVVGSSRVNTDKESRDYGVKTRYVRTVFSLALKENESFTAPVCGSALTGERNSDRPRRERRRSLITGTDKRLNTAALRIRMKPVFCFFASEEPQVDDATLYAWLSREELEYLCSTSGENFLKTWVNTLQLPEKEGRFKEIFSQCSQSTPVFSQQASEASEAYLESRTWMCL